MNNDIRRFGNDAWNRLFSQLYKCDEAVTDAEVDEDLKNAKIDMRSANARLRQMIEQKRAREQFAGAGERRATALSAIRCVVMPTVRNLRADVKTFIESLFSGPEQAVHFHKLEKAATDDDLQSLMNDLQCLVTLRKTKESDEPPAQ